MFASAFTLVLAAASLVSAAPSRRDTPQISCDDAVSGGGNKIQLQDSGNNNLVYIAFNGQRDGQGRQNLVTLNSDGSPSSGSHFSFRHCSSQYMGYDKESSSGINYGLLYWTASPQHCVAVADVQGTNTRFVNAKCSYDDDESQLAQFWAVSPRGDVATLLGNVNGTKDGFYSLSIGDTGHKKVQVDWDTNLSDSAQGNALTFIKY